MDIKGYEKMLADDFKSLQDDQYDPNQERIQQASLPGNQKVKIEQVYQMLMGQRFTEWYLTEFEEYVGWGGPPHSKSKEEILVDLKALLA